MVQARNDLFMPQDISPQNAVSHKGGLTFLQGFPFCLSVRFTQTKNHAPFSGWQSRLFLQAEEMPAFKEKKHVLPVLCSSPKSTITDWRPDLAAQEPDSHRQGSSAALSVGEAAEAARRARCLRADAKPRYGATTALPRPSDDVAAVVMCPLLYATSRLTSPGWKNHQSHQFFIAPSGNWGLSTPLPGNRILSQLRKTTDFGLLTCFLSSV